MKAVFSPATSHAAHHKLLAMGTWPSKPLDDRRYGVVSRLSRAMMLPVKQVSTSAVAGRSPWIVGTSRTKGVKRTGQL